MRRHLFCWLSLVVLSACGSTVSLGPSEDAGAEGGDSGSDGPTAPDGCSLPSDGDTPKTGIRLANLTPSDETVDFCIKPAAQGDYQSADAFLRSFGTACPLLSYPQVLRPLALEAGSYDIKVVRGDAPDCNSPGISGLTGVSIPPDTVVTVARLGGVGGVPEKLVALPEVHFPKDQSTRFVHAVSTPETIYFGFAASSRLPSRVEPNITGHLSLGEAPAPNPSVIGIGPINAHGYLGTLTVEWDFAAARTGNQEAVLVTTTQGAKMYTIFAVGLPGSERYPVRGLLCNEQELDGMFTDCTLSPLPSLQVDTIDVSLYGEFAPFAKERRESAIQAVAGLDTDFVCVQEIARDQDRTALINAAAGRFPYSVAPELDLDTPFTDPRDQNGAVPPAAGPACGEAEVVAQMNAALACVTENCADNPGDPDSPLGDVGDGCITGLCTPQFVPLIFGSVEDNRCFTCLVTQLLSSETINDTRTLCAEDSRQPFAFRGASSSILLSRHPISKQEIYVLPSTGYRRTLIHAEAQLGAEPASESVDVFCTHLSYIHGTTFPYAGDYGLETAVDGVPAPLTGWSAENYLQAQRAVGWITSRTQPGRLAIIAGNLSSSDQDVPDLTALNPATLRLFRQTFSEAVATGHEPQCDFCAFPENPYGGDTRLWLSHIFTHGLDVRVDSDERTLMDKTVTLPQDPFEGTVSDSFGRHVELRYPIPW